MKVTTNNSSGSSSAASADMVSFSANEEHKDEISHPDPNTQALHRHRLLLLRHALKCPYGKGQCTVSRHCWKLKELWKHILRCKDDRCRTPLCASSRFVLYHYGHCTEANCEVCVPVKETYKRTHTEEEERELLRCPAAKRMRVSGSQQNFNTLLCRKSNSFDEGREARTRIIRDSDLGPFLDKFASIGVTLSTTVEERSDAEDDTDTVTVRPSESSTHEVAAMDEPASLSSSCSSQTASYILAAREPTSFATTI